MEAMEALALVSGRVEQELLVRNEYLATENRILKSKLKKPVRLNDNERIQLARIGKRIGLQPSPNRHQDMTWANFIKKHQNVIAA